MSIFLHWSILVSRDWWEIYQVGKDGSDYPYLQKAKLMAGDGLAYDRFSWSVAFDGDTVVVGAPTADVEANTDQGSAYVFVRSPTGWTYAIQTAKLTASDGEANDWFGVSLTIQDDTVVVGAHRDHGSKGAAYVFVRPNQGWTDMTQTAKLTSSDGLAYDLFGIDVDISENTIVATAQRRGAAYVFVRPLTGWADMHETARLDSSSDVYEHFGYSAAISGNAIAVGAEWAEDGGSSQQG